MAHWEMISSMIFQLTHNTEAEELWTHGLIGLCGNAAIAAEPPGSAGVPPANGHGGDKQSAVADLCESLACEQRARLDYEMLLHMTDDPDVAKPLSFLREREIVHFQRIGEALVSIQSL